MNPFAGKNPFAPDGGAPIEGVLNGNRLVQYSNNLDNPFVLVAGPYQFEIWQNTSDQFATLGVKAAKAGDTIPIVFCMTAYWGTSLQNYVSKVTLNSDAYQTIDNDLGYDGGTDGGGAHLVWLMRTDTGEPMRVFVLSTKKNDTDTEAVTVASITAEWGGFPGAI